MIGAAPKRSAWIEAGLISVVLHGAALAALTYQPNWFQAEGELPEAPEFTVTALDLTSAEAETENSVSGVTEADPAAPDVTPVEPEVITPQDQVIAAAESPALSPILTDENAPLVASSTVEPDPTPSTAPVGGDGTTPPPATTSDTPVDPRLVELFDRIRSRLTEPCLLALPAVQGDGQLQLKVMAADDRKISALMRDLTEGSAEELTEVSALLDQRQCPGLAFARADPRYPVFGLGIKMAQQSVENGGSLKGEVTATPGWYTTLVVVDDNGVVHDMRRFLVRSGNRVLFDIPIARMGRARDTQQLVIAVATPARPASVSQMAGLSADAFFDALGREVGQSAMVGVSSIYIR